MRVISIFFIFFLSIYWPVQAQPADGLLLQLDLNGNYLDSSPNAYDVNGFNGTFVSDDLGNAEGALSANGNNTYAAFPNIPALKPDFPITMAVRVKFDYLDGTQIIAATDFGVTTHSGAWIQVSSQDKLTASFGNAAGGFDGSSRHGKQANLVLQSDTWYSIVVIFRGYHDIDMYIDCELLEGSYTGSAQSIGYTTAPGSLCRKRGNPESVTPPYYLSGDIDYFYYWDRELNPDEIIPLCNICNKTIETQNNQGCINSGINYNFEFSGDANDIADILWTFGDGSTSTSHTPTHIYDSAGSFPFSVQVIMSDGCQYETEGITEISQPPEPPVLPDTISICEGESYLLDLSEFTDWDQILGPDGNPVTSYLFDEPGNYNFTFNDMCAEQIEQFIEVSQTNTAGYLNYTGENPICESTMISIEINDWNEIENLSSLNLNFGDGNVQSVDDTVIMNQYNQSGLYTVELSGTVSGCEVYEFINLSVEAPIDFQMESFYDICEGDSVSIDFNDYPFTVSDSTGNPMEITFFESSGIYTLIAENACGIVSKEIEVLVRPFNPAPTSQDIEICPVVDTVMIGLTNDSYNYNWNNGQTTAMMAVSSGGTYTVLVSDSADYCSSSYTFIINEIPIIRESIFDYSQIEFCKEGNALLVPNNLGYYYSFPDGSIGDSFHVLESGQISVSYTDGCYLYRDSVNVIITNCLCPIEVPNIFTPNSDLRNDIFLPSYSCPTPFFKMSIYNRWGELVFKSNNIDWGWDGNPIDSSVPSSEGIYFYTIEYGQNVDGVSYHASLNGTVVLTR